MTRILTIAPPPIALLRRGDQTVDIDRALRHGEVTRVMRGVYARSREWQDLPPWHRYLAEVHATALVHPDAVFCLESAAALTGQPYAGTPRDVHVLDERYSASRRIGRMRVHASCDERRLLQVDGCTLTAPEETALDIARSRHPALGLAAVDALLRLEEWDDASALVELNDSRLSSRGRRAARWSLERATGLAESVLESVSRAVAEWLGYPEPVLQVPFSLPSGQYRVDMFWEDQRVVGEADGRLKYDGTLGDGGASLWDEKRREDAIRAQVSAVARWGWAECRDYRAFDRALARTGLERERLVHVAPLISLAAALRS